MNWANSRTYFYWRLLRRLKEFDLVNQIMRNDTSATSDTPSLAAPQTAPGIRKITFNKFQKFIEAKVTSYSPEWWENDEAVLQWYGENESVVSEYVAQQKSTGIATDISRNLSEILSVASAESAQGLLQSALSSLTPEQKQLMLNALK